MAESKLRTLSVDFAVQILNLVKALKSQHETIVSNQIGRAGTSIGANIHEVQYAHGKADFIAKLQIVGGRNKNAGKFLSAPNGAPFTIASTMSSARLFKPSPRVTYGGFKP